MHLYDRNDKRGLQITKPIGGIAAMYRLVQNEVSVIRRITRIFIFKTGINRDRLIFIAHYNAMIF